VFTNLKLDPKDLAYLQDANYDDATLQRIADGLSQAPTLNSNGSPNSATASQDTTGGGTADTSAAGNTDGTGTALTAGSGQPGTPAVSQQPGWTPAWATRFHNLLLLTGLSEPEAQKQLQAVANNQLPEAQLEQVYQQMRSSLGGWNQTWLQRFNATLTQMKVPPAEREQAIGAMATQGMSTARIQQVYTKLKQQAAMSQPANMRNWTPRLRNLDLPAAMMSQLTKGNIPEQAMQQVYGSLLKAKEAYSKNGRLKQLDDAGANADQKWGLMIKPDPSSGGYTTNNISNADFSKAVNGIHDSHVPWWKTGLSVVANFIPGYGALSYAFGHDLVTGDHIDRSNPLSIGMAALSVIPMAGMVRGPLEGIGGVVRGAAAIREAASAADAAKGLSEVGGIAVKAADEGSTARAALEATTAGKVAGQSTLMDGKLGAAMTRLATPWSKAAATEKGMVPLTLAGKFKKAADIAKMSIPGVNRVGMGRELLSAGRGYSKLQAFHVTFISHLNQLDDPELASRIPGLAKAEDSGVALTDAQKADIATITEKTGMSPSQIQKISDRVAPALEGRGDFWAAGTRTRTINPLNNHATVRLSDPAAVTARATMREGDVQSALTGAGMDAKQAEAVVNQMGDLTKAGKVANPKQFLADTGMTPEKAVATVRSVTGKTPEQLVADFKSPVETVTHYVVPGVGRVPTDELATTVEGRMASLLKDPAQAKRLMGATEELSNNAGDLSKIEPSAFLSETGMTPEEATARFTEASGMTPREYETAIGRYVEPAPLPSINPTEINAAFEAQLGAREAYGLQKWLPRMAEADRGGKPIEGAEAAAFKRATGVTPSNATGLIFEKTGLSPSEYQDAIKAHDAAGVATTGGGAAPDGAATAGRMNAYRTTTNGIQRVRNGAGSMKERVANQFTRTYGTEDMGRVDLGSGFTHGHNIFHNPGGVMSTSGGLMAGDDFANIASHLTGTPLREMATNLGVIGPHFRMLAQLRRAFMPGSMQAILKDSSMAAHDGMAWHAVQGVGRLAQSQLFLGQTLGATSLAIMTGMAARSAQPFWDYYKPGSTERAEANAQQHKADQQFQQEKTSLDAAYRQYEAQQSSGGGSGSGSGSGSGPTGDPAAASATASGQTAQQSQAQADALAQQQAYTQQAQLTQSQAPQTPQEQSAYEQQLAYTNGVPAGTAPDGTTPAPDPTATPTPDPTATTTPDVTTTAATTPDTTGGYGATNTTSPYGTTPDGSVGTGTDTSGYTTDSSGSYGGNVAATA
jgi:hypothetical protein